jgi:alkanesulfonate monooxygenase SsuD/methylene tetrahydromethanopterin reductase-like flavin-dependent oxidoreductase (luciferase family)
MKLLWTEEEPEFEGEFVSFPKVRMYPKPAQKPYPPIVFGGESGPALKRVGEVGDGWFGVNVNVEDATKHIEQIRQMAKAAGRDPQKLHFSVSPGLGAPVELDMVKRYRDVGVDQVMLGAIPTDPSKIRADIERLAEKIVVPAERI